MQYYPKLWYKKVRDGIKVLLWDIEYTAFEVFNGLTILSLGFSFLNNQFASARVIYRTFTGSSATYVVHAIAGVMILFGILKMIALTQHQSNPTKWLRWRMNLAGIGTFMWGFLFAVFANYPIKPASLIFIISLIGFSMWAFIRLILERRGQRLLDPEDSFKNE